MVGLINDVWVGKRTDELVGPIDLLLQNCIDPTDVWTVRDFAYTCARMHILTYMGDYVSPDALSCKVSHVLVGRVLSLRDVLPAILLQSLRNIRGA